MTTDAAARALRMLGFSAVDVSEDGEYVVGSEVVAHVHTGPAPVDVAAVAAAREQASEQGKRPVVFAVSGFTPEAVSEADEAHVALFTLGRAGVEPAGEAARRLLDRYEEAIDEELLLLDDEE